MKLINTLNIIGALAICGLALTTHAQCPETCDSNDNIAIGNGAGIGNQQNVAVGGLALHQAPINAVDNVAVGFAALANSRSTNGPNEDTAIGAGAIQFNKGDLNTAVGYEALYGVSNSSHSSNNTAIGSQSLFSNTTGNNNMASGYQALFSDTMGGSNTASGHNALYFNTTGNFNTASGRGALFHNTAASNNVATGYQALNSNETGAGNTATGTQALQSDTGAGNTADGYQALNKNTVGFQNVATGSQALFANTSGTTNTAVGGFALGNSQTGSGNIAIGFNAGSAVTSGSNDVDIANTGANESGTIRIGSSNQTNTYIAGISGVTVAGGIGVIVDSSGHLGTSTSSARYKKNIQPMDKASEAILSLQPVTFHYKKELDPQGIPQFGLIAEQVEKVDRDLVARDDQGKPYSVRYEAVNAMLLNEFLKEHRQLEEQGREIAQLQSALAEQQKNFESMAAAEEKKTAVLTADLQKVSARLESRASSTKVVAND